MHTRSRIPESPAKATNPGEAQPETSGADASRSSVSREFHNLLADIEELIGATTSLAGEDLTKLREQLSERVTAAKQSVDELGHSVDQQARRTASVTNEYVHQQPWTAVGVGLGVGFVLGLLLARRG